MTPEELAAENEALKKRIAELESALKSKDETYSKILNQLYSQLAGSTE